VSGVFSLIGNMNKAKFLKIICLINEICSLMHIKGFHLFNLCMTIENMKHYCYNIIWLWNRENYIDIIYIFFYIKKIANVKKIVTFVLIGQTKKNLQPIIN
jgi:hypothetical protein